MKHFIVIAMAALFLVGAAVPAYANTRQENNQNIADFVLDTIKLPWILMGTAFTTRDHEQVKEEMNYKEHRGLNNALSGDVQYIGK